MRPLLAILLTTLLLLGTAGYTQFAKRVKRPPVSLEAEIADANFEVEIDRTFNAVPDRLAELPALEVLFHGQPVFSVDQPLDQQATVRFELPPGVELGINEINVLANRPLMDTQLAALRVTIFRNQVPIVHQAIISDPDLSTLNGTVLFDSPPEVEHDH